MLAILLGTLFKNIAFHIVVFLLDYRSLSHEHSCCGLLLPHGVQDPSSLVG